MLSGAQGTGKSSILSKFPVEKYNLVKHDSMSRLFMKNKDTQDPLNANYMEFQHKIFLYCYNLYINTDNFICSRGFADGEAYVTSSWFSNHKLRDELSILNNLIDIYTEIIKKEKDTYHFYLPIEFPISSDNNDLRRVEAEFQSEIDYRIKSYFLSHNIKYTTLTGNVDNRIKQIEEVINENKS